MRLYKINKTIDDAKIKRKDAENKKLVFLENSSAIFFHFSPTFPGLLAIA